MFLPKRTLMKSYIITFFALQNEDIGASPNKSPPAADFLLTLQAYKTLNLNHKIYDDIYSNFSPPLAATQQKITSVNR